MSSQATPLFRALVIGFYGAPNVGDEVLLSVLLAQVTRMGGEGIVASVDPATTRRMHGVESVDFNDLGEVSRALLQVDVVIMGGGGIFQDHHPFHLEALYLPYANDIASYARPLLMARQLGVPVVIWGHGVGPLRGQEPRQVVRDLFQNALAVSVRDSDSLRLLRDVGVSREVAVAADPGWLFSELAPIADQIEAGPKTLAVVVREWGKGVWKPQLAQALANVVPVGWRIKWVAFQAHTEGSGAISDLPLIEELRSLYPRPQSEFDEVCCPADPLQAWELLCSADAVFSMRLHASILALLAGRPTCGLEYDDKLEKAHAMAGMPAVARLHIGDDLQRFEAALGHAIEAAWRPEPGTIEGLKASARKHLQLLDVCVGLPARDSTFEAGRMDWLSIWLQQSLREARQQREASERAHELLHFRDLQLAGLEEEKAEAKREVVQANLATAQIREMLGERDASMARLEETLADAHAAVAQVQQKLADERAESANFRMAAAASREELLERSRGMMEQVEARLSLVEARLKETEIALANARDELDHRKAYIDDKEIYIAMLRQQLEESQHALDTSRRELVEARDVWRRVRLGAEIARRDLLRAAAAPFKIAAVWRRYGFKVAMQQIPRRMKTFGVPAAEVEVVSPVVAPSVKALRKERLLVIVDRAFDSAGWPLRPMQLARAAERAGMHVRLCALHPHGAVVDDPTGQNRRICTDSVGWLNDVRAEGTRVLLADGSPAAVELAASAHARGAEIIVDFASIGNAIVGSPGWAAIEAIASRGVHGGTAPASLAMPLQLLQEMGDNEVFDSYRTYAFPAGYSRNRANILVLQGASDDRGLLLDLVNARHDAVFHVVGHDGATLENIPRVKNLAAAPAPAVLAELLAHADCVVVPHNGGGGEHRARSVIASLLLQRPTLVEVPLQAISSGNLHVIDRASLSTQLCLTSVEDYAFVASNTWLGAVEALVKPSYPASVSVVVLIHNNRRIIERCIRTILDHAGQWLEEIVIVDNQSVDGGAELVEALFAQEPKVKLVRNSENGCSSGRNLGVQHSSGQYIAFFDSDQWLTAPSCFPEAVSILNMDEGVGAIGWNAGWFDATRDDLGGPISDYLPHRGMNAEALAKGFRDDIGFLGTSCMFMKRELFERIEGFDTFYDPTCFEDTDICFQIKQAGYSVAFRDLAGVRHQPHQTTGASEGSERYKRLFNRNAAYFKEKWAAHPEFFLDLRSWH